MINRIALFLLLTAVPTAAEAFCGFFVSGADAKLTNNASQVVLMRKGNRTVMTMSNNYKGPTEDFAMVVPVPVVLHKEDVKTLEPNVFEHIDALSAPRLVEYWEQDPCFQPRYEAMKSTGAPPRSAPKMKRGAAADEDFGVKVEARFTVGEYEIVILSAKEANGLESWLKFNKYRIPDQAAPALAPYVRSQMKFFVAKVNIQKVKRDSHGAVVLSPLRFSFESQELRLPVRLGLINADGKQDLIVYILHPTSRFQTANYPNVFIPTNLEVLDDVRKSFGAFYAQLFDETMAKANNKAVVTEYAWQTTSCDPCPVPPLQPSDLYTLGNDILSGAQAPAPTSPQQPPSPQRPPPGMRPSFRGRPGFFGNFSPWVLTRLHTRYDRETLSEDLIFQEARPMVGGRSTFDGTSMELPGEVKPDSTNNFQGRYIIRHYWNGPVACQGPRYGVWGGPPGGGQRALQHANDLANAPRGQIALRRVVRSALPQLGLPGMAVPRRGQK
ncbi:MAG: DUF2330 domain-containing protein [Myxococcales bacterium]|nr:DUF2330 domain-containing protein [Myxococcales bacterium]